MPRIIDDDDFDGQFGRTLAAAMFGTADVGEALATAARITPGDLGSWHDEWTVTAVSAEAEAEAALAGGHHLSAAQAGLRASEYHRQAFFYVRDDLASPVLADGYRRHRDTFRAAAGRLPFPVEAVAIPCLGTTLNGYLARPDDAGTPRPTVVLPAGYDSTAESGYLSWGPAALEHGCNLLTFEGPGQGGVLYERGLTFRPDFEAVLTPTVDWLVAQPGVDPGALILFGRSFAGYLAPRGAAFEPRLAGLVCDPVQLDFGAAFRGRFGDEIVDRAMADDATLDGDLAFLLEDPRRRNFFASRMVTHGVDTLSGYIREICRFTAADVASQISCPALLLDAEGDPVGSGQVDQLAAALDPARTTVHRFTAAEGAGGHCEGTGQRRVERVVHDWIDETLAARG
jgi:dienelactone hydrolase